jgi:hypothetical protein
MLVLIRRLLGIREKKAAGHGPVRIILYKRKGCHLCDDARGILQGAQQLHPFIYSEIDVDSDSTLVGRYGDRVPVIAVNDKIRFWGRVNRALLERLLEAEAGRPARQDA